MTENDFSVDQIVEKILHPFYHPQTLSYQRAHHHERLLPFSYVAPHSYKDRFQKDRSDTTRFTPFASMQKFAKQGNEGLYGWTFRNKDGHVHLRDDLSGYSKLETDLHECGHTPDERETRYRTEEKLRAMIPQEEKYKTKPPMYDR